MDSRFCQDRVRPHFYHFLLRWDSGGSSLESVTNSQSIEIRAAGIRSVVRAGKPNDTRHTCRRTTGPGVPEAPRANSDSGSSIILRVLTNNSCARRLFVGQLALNSLQIQPGFRKTGLNKIGRRRNHHLAARIDLDPLRTLRELRIVDDFLPPSGRAAERNDARKG